MYKKTVTYEDYNGVTHTEDFYFNLNKVELAELEFSVGPGESLSGSIGDILKANDYGTIISTIKHMLLMAYGEKSSDGKRFIKNDKLREEFEQSPAFEEIFWEFGTNNETFAEFITGVIPSAMRNGLGPDPKKTLMSHAEEMRTSKLN